MFATPELIEAQPVEVRNEVEVALELQHWMLAEGMVRRQKGAKF